MEAISQLQFNDIYNTIDLNLYTSNYKYLDNNQKKEVIEQEFKKYLISKIREANSNIIVDESMEVYQLIEIISMLLGINKDSNFMHLINYLLITMSNEQQFVITWEQNQQEKTLTQPEIVIQNNIITRIITNKESNVSSIFNYLNNYYLTEFNKERTR